jgi:hypothetical protein
MQSHAAWPRGLSVAMQMIPGCIALTCCKGAQQSHDMVCKVSRQAGQQVLEEAVVQRVLRGRGGVGGVGGGRWQRDHLRCVWKCVDVRECMCG